jgi:hypothetical protein
MLFLCEVAGSKLHCSIEFSLTFHLDARTIHPDLIQVEEKQGETGTA